MLIPITSDFLPTNRYFLSNYGLENKKTGLHCDHSVSYTHLTLPTKQVV